MTDISSAPTRVLTTGGAFYRLVWKWHFLASLYVLPFFAILSITGAMYLYKPQIEGWLYGDQINVIAAGTAKPFEEQIASLEGATRIRAIATDGDPTTSTVVEYDDADRVRSIAWINPYTAEVLGSVERDRMFMRVLQKIHGEILLGSFGTKFVELAAHWAIVMFITGVYMWWPRGQRNLAKAMSPPKGKGRAWWREAHLFVGMLATVLVLPILISGLPWTDIWGGGLSVVQQQTGQESKNLRWGGARPTSTTDQGTPIPYDVVFDIAAAQGLVAPYEMVPPRKSNEGFYVRSDSINRNEQSELIIDQYSGAVLARNDFADNPPVAKAVSYGISFHRGELYGWTNVIQNTIAALSAFFLSVTGFVAWWKRRPAKTLGVPKAPEAALGGGMIALVIVLGLLFPLMGASLVLALILDWAIFKRLGWFQSY